MSCTDASSLNEVPVAQEPVPSRGQVEAGAVTGPGRHRAPVRQMRVEPRVQHPLAGVNSQTGEAREPDDEHK